MSLTIICSDDLRYTRRNYEKMVSYVSLYIREHDITHIISGDSVLSTNLAVELYLLGRVDTLTLYLPCKFDGNYFISTSKGKKLNIQHEILSLILNVNSLSNIKKAVEKGAKISVKSNPRNLILYMSKSNKIISFVGMVPSKSKTLSIWNKHVGEKVRVCIYSL